MPTTESAILSNFLLPPAPLPTIISQRKFIELFPKAERSDPLLLTLYRELQQQRATDTDDVKRNIEAEVKRGEAQRREVGRARRRADKEQLQTLDKRELHMDFELFGPAANAPPLKEHTIKTLLPEMEQACKDMEAEIADLETEADQMTERAKETIGDLSDLRYGRLPSPLQDVLSGIHIPT